ncbi:hypothetical protein ABK040_003115 [Willaertia magna]
MVTQKAGNKQGSNFQVEIDSVEEWEKILLENQNTPNHILVVDVHATWCGKCLSILPTFERISIDYRENTALKFVALDGEKVLTQLKTLDKTVDDASDFEYEDEEEIDKVNALYKDDVKRKNYKEILKAHNGTSEPLFLFFKEGELIRKIRGVNTPPINKLIVQLVNSEEIRPESKKEVKREVKTEPIKPKEEDTVNMEEDQFDNIEDEKVEENKEEIAITNTEEKNSEDNLVVEENTNKEKDEELKPENKIEEEKNEENKTEEINPQETKTEEETKVEDKSVVEENKPTTENKDEETTNKEEEKKEESLNNEEDNIPLISETIKQPKDNTVTINPNDMNHTEEEIKKVEPIDDDTEIHEGEETEMPPSPHNVEEENNKETENSTQ